MKNKDIYDKVRDKLINHEVDLPDECWNAIDKRLAFSRRQEKHRNLWYAIAAAIAALTVFVIFTDKKDENTVYTAELNKTEQIGNFIGANNNVNTEKTEPVKNNIKSLYTRNNTSSKEDIILTKCNNRYQNGSVAKKNEDVVNHVTAYNITEKADSLKNAVLEEKSDDAKCREYIKELKGSSTFVTTEPETYTQYEYDKGFSISIVAANSISANGSTSDKKLTMSSQTVTDELHLYSAPEPLHFKHKMPISVGMTVEKRWKNNWGLESGIVYTLLRSTYTTESHSHEGEQELHYVGIPIQATYRFAQLKRFGFYAAAGPKIDFNIAGKRTETVQNSVATNNSSENIRDKTPQFSLLLRAGVSFDIVKRLELYVEPSIAYYINNNGDIQDLWKDRPFNFVLQFGLRT
ncbi:MAG: porin family protein, partial [Bacteroidales bacterium]